MLIPFLPCACLLAAGPTSGTKAEVDKVIEPLLKDHKNIGIIVGVITPRGREVFGYGAGPLPNKPLAGDTIFEIGSITKVFTALLLEEMVKNGNVKLDDPVQLYLPEGARVPKREDREITLKDLATHTSGLPVQPSLFVHLLTHPEDKESPYAHYAAKDLYEYLGKLELKRKIGSKYEYSNLGMGLLGNALVHRAKAKSYEALVIERICKPLAMKDTAITLSEKQRMRYASGHKEDDKPASDWNFATLEGCGALRSTANDLLRFVAANLGLEKTKLLASMEACRQPLTEGSRKEMKVGLGWHIVPLPGSDKQVTWHNGGTGGYRSFLGFVKETKTGVVVLCNSNPLKDKIDRAALEILTACNREN
ncbi:MAG: serine hydrolase domain-containing protein [Gemmataceae bacterium]